MAKKKRTVKPKIKEVIKEVMKDPPLEEEVLIIRIPELTEEEYEQLVSHIRDKHEKAQIFALQRECLFGGV